MIEKIEQKQIDDNSVSKLSTRPNAPSAMGGNGLNAAELRARFDALAKLAIDKINEILAYLNGDELKDGTTAPPFASLIKFTGDDGEEYTLEGILDALQKGEFFPVDIVYNPNSTHPQSGMAVKQAYYRLQDFATKYTDARYESVAADLESAEQRIEEVDQQSQQRTEQAKQELVDYVEDALQDIDVDVQVSGAIGAHNINPYAHQDIRTQLGALRDRINAALNSDDTSLDQLKEIVAYIKSNKSLIDAITTSKVGVDAIADNLTTNDSKKVLSAKQGMILKQEIPLVLPYVFEWGKSDEIKVGDENSVAVKYFNRIPKPRTEEYEGDRFFGYFYTKNSHKHYHVSAVVTEVRDNIQPDNAITFEVEEVVQFIPTVDQAYQPTSTNAQSGKAVAQAIAKTITQEPGESETLVMSQKAVTELVADALGNDTPTYETVNSVDEMTDTTKQYVLASTGTVWAYTTKEVHVEHNAYDADTAIFNKRLAGDGTTPAFDGAVVLDFVEQAYDFENCFITIDGVDNLASIWTDAKVCFTVVYYDSAKNVLGYAVPGELWGGWTQQRPLDDYSTPWRFKPFHTSKGALEAVIQNTAYLRMFVCLKHKEAISAADCEGLIVEFENKSGNQMVSSWEDTGLAPACETVQSVEEMTDTSKQYVLASTGTVWTYSKVTIEVEAPNKFVSGTATLNKRLSGSSGSVSTTAGSVGSFITDFIEVSDMADISPYIARLNWELPEISENKVLYFNSSKARIGNTILSTNNVTVSNGETVLDLKTPYTGNNSAVMPTWTDVKYVRFQLFVNPTQTELTSTDIADITITFDADAETVTEYRWYDTGLPPSASGSGNYVTLLMKINENTAQIHELDKRVTVIEAESGTVTIPSYWEETVAEKIQTVQALQEEGGADCFSFVWASDTHCAPNQAASGQYSTSKNVGKLANRLMNDLNIPFFAVTGDLSADIGSISDPSIDKTDIDAFFDAIVLPVGKERVLLTLGNHDGTTYTSPQTNDKSISKATRFNWFMRPFCDDNKRIWGGGEYYYVDHHQGKIRFIALCSNNGTENIYRKNHYDGNQLKWLAEEALNAPKGYTVVVLSHFPSNGKELGGSPANSDVLMAILTAFDTKNNYSGSADGVSISATYSNSDAILCGFFAGHIHNDTIDTSKGFPIITVDAAGNKTEVADRTFKNGSATETVFDVVSINKAARKIYCTRVGAGVDREISY